MADRRVECANVRQKYPRREGITHLGGAWGTSAKADAIKDIQNHTHTYYTFEGGKRADVKVEGGEFVETYADGTRANNLLSLKDC
jgi:hypothetical protein